MLKQLRKELQEVYQKRDELQDWLMNHINHPDFDKIAKDRRELMVEGMTLEYKISQLESGLPILGNDEFPKSEQNKYVEKPSKNN